MLERLGDEDEAFRWTDRSTDEEREAERKRIHVVGERSAKDAVVTLPLRLTYLCDLAADEIEPVIGVHTSLRKPPKVGYTRFPVVWDKNKPGQQSVAHKLDINIGVHFPWPRDASLWVQMFAKMKSSEGVYRLEKAGSACLPLHTLVGSKVETVEMGTPTGTFSVPLILQEARIMQEQPFFKGSIQIDYNYGRGRQRDSVSEPFRPLYLEASGKHFQKETEWDVTERNISFLETRMLRTVSHTIMHSQRRLVQTQTGPKGGFEPGDKPGDK